METVQTQKLFLLILCPPDRKGRRGEGRMGEERDGVREG